MTDVPEPHQPDAWLREFLRSIDAESKYITTIGPFLYQMLLLETVMRTMAVMLFALPETPQADLFDEAIFGTKPTAGHVASQLLRVMKAKDRATPEFVAELDRVKELIGYRNALAHRLPKFILDDDAPAKVRISGTDHTMDELVGAADRARNARHRLQTAYIRANLGPQPG